MSYGLKLKNSQNQPRLDTTDRITRVVTSFEGSRLCDSSFFGASINSSIGPWAAHFTSLFYLPYPGVTNDGTWAGIIESLSASFGYGLNNIPEYLTGYCIMEPGRCVLVINSLIKNFWAYPHQAGATTADINGLWGRPESILTYKVKLVRF